MDLSSLLSLPLRAAADIRARQFLRKDPLDSQRQLLPRLLRNAAATRFGVSYGFAGLASLPFESCYQRFQQQVPIRTYRQFWDDWFAASLTTTPQGQQLRLQDQTWPGLAPWLCETSGTTAPTKFIPFTAEMFRMNQRAALDMLCCYLAAEPGSRVPGGKILYMAGSTQLKQMGAGVLAGDMSAITLQQRPAWLNPFVEPQEPLTSAPWDQRLDGMARLLLDDQKIRIISGVPPWILLLLKQVTALSGRSVVETLPNLELIIHGGTSMTPYLAEYQRLIPNDGPRFLELLPSSEAFMGFQVHGESAMRLTPFYGAFFEFVPIEELDETGAPLPNARAIPLAEVVVGQRYAVILSTCAGLWRYHIGDTLRFLDTDRFRFEFTGRDKFLDRFEEKVTQTEVEQAVAVLNQRHEGLVREFMVGADIVGRCHHWVLACRGKEILPDQAATLLDDQLRRANADYDTFRQQGRINIPSVLLVSEQQIYDWSAQVRGKLGGQSKIPHIDPTLTGELVQSLSNYACR
ncbi:MAG: GH3 auxin-responsive promoter family protein [Geobacter sp.]|nr:GH3 auxin-responsive promoter family protein [Geobacter sp.]